MEMFANWNDSLNNDSMFINETQSLTCAARSIQQEVTYNSTSNMVLRSFKIISSILIIIFGVLLNSMVLVLVKKFKSLQTFSFAIALQVIAIDLIRSSITHPAILVTAIANKWLFGEYVCILTGFVNFSSILARIVLMLTLVIDRFCSIFMPFYYPNRRRKIMLSLSLAAWSLAILLCTLMLPGLIDCYTYVPQGSGCYYSLRCNRQCTILLNFTVFFVILPFSIVPIFLFGALFWKAKKIKKRTVLALNDLTDNGSATKRNWRATITFFLLFIVQFVVFIPLVLALTFLRFIFSSSPWLNFIQILSANLLALLVIVDPLFIMRDRDMRIAMAELKWFPSLFC